MRTNTSLRILVGDTVIAWGAARVSAANDDQKQSVPFWRLAAGRRDEASQTVYRGPVAVLTKTS